MKDKHARALAIVGLVFMGIFLAALIATFVNRSIFNGGIGFVALGAGVVVMMIFIALKADGRGYSITKMNNEIEMQRIEEELKRQEEAQNAEAEADVTAAEEPAEQTTEQSEEAAE